MRARVAFRFYFYTIVWGLLVHKHYLIISLVFTFIYHEKQNQSIKHFRIELSPQLNAFCLFEKNVMYICLIHTRLPTDFVNCFFNFKNIFQFGFGIG